MKTERNRERDTKVIKPGMAFAPKAADSPGGIAYVREVEENYITFSILGYYTEEPGLTGCGVFTLTRDNFNILYIPITRWVPDEAEHS